MDRFEFAEALVRVALRMVASKNNTREDAPTDVLEALHVLFEQHHHHHLAMQIRMVIGFVQKFKRFLYLAEVIMF